MSEMKRFLLAAILVSIGGWLGAAGTAAGGEPAGHRISTAPAPDAAALFAGSKWIGHPADYGRYRAQPVMRKIFSHAGGRGRIAICGLGHYRATLNGKPLADRGEVMLPGWSDTRKTCLYDVYDVGYVPGTNVLEVLLGNGMYNVPGTGRYTKFVGSQGWPKLLVGGDIASDGTWEAGWSPLFYSHVYSGDSVNGGTAPWGWTAAKVVDAPLGTLRRSRFQVRTFASVPAVSSKVVNDHLTVFDFGQNAAYVPSLTVKGEKGATVVIRMAEWVDGNGLPADAGGSQGTFCTYVLGGNPDGETFQPPFFYRGYRWASVERKPAPNAAALPEIIAFSSRVVHADVPKAGAFESSEGILNKVRDLVLWAQKSNMMSVFTDCPHREKLGWLEQYNIHSDQLRWEWDVGEIFAKCTRDMADAQLENGMVPDIAPEFTIFRGGFRDSVHWGSSMILVPWQQYEWNGDDTLIREYYPQMKAYLGYVRSVSPGFITAGGLGDWVELGANGGPAKGTPRELTATVYYYRDAVVMAECAKMLGKAEDEAAFREEAEKIKAAFNAKWWHPETANYAGGSQTDNAMALVWGLSDPAYTDRIVANIVDDIRMRGNAVTAGDIGYPFLIRALGDARRSDVIFDMTISPDKPGYAFMVKNGETSLHESWDCNPSMSRNHFMLGDVLDWYYRDLAGIRRTSPGFATFDVAPQFVPRLNHVKASYTPHGRGTITVEWIRDPAGPVSLTVTVPPGTAATVRLPGRDPIPLTPGTHTHRF